MSDRQIRKWINPKRVYVIMPLTLAFAVAAVFSCSPKTEDAETELAAEATATSQLNGADSWITLVENASIRASLDTSRIRRFGDTAEVWIAFDLAEPWPPLEDIKSPYKHFEAFEQIRCREGLVRDSLMYFTDVQNVVYRKSAPEPRVWKPFAEQGVGEETFSAACSQLQADRL